VAEYGAKKWSVIAEKVPGRIGKQCRERWLNHLDTSVKKTPWTDIEDQLLLDAQKKLGNRWCEIARLLPGRPENAVKNRFNSLNNRGRVSADGRILSKSPSLGEIPLPESLSGQVSPSGSTAMGAPNRLSPKGSTCTANKVMEVDDNDVGAGQGPMPEQLQIPSVVWTLQPMTSNDLPTKSPKDVRVSPVLQMAPPPTNTTTMFSALFGGGHTVHNTDHNVVPPPVTSNAFLDSAARARLPPKKALCSRRHSQVSSVTSERSLTPSDDVMVAAANVAASKRSRIEEMQT
jgi:hypothetical protein